MSDTTSEPRATASNGASGGAPSNGTSAQAPSNGESEHQAPANAPYLVRVGGREIPVDPKSGGDAVRLDHISGRRFLLHIRGRTIPLVIQEGDRNSLEITAKHRRFDVEVLDERAQLLSRLGVGGGASGVAADLKAPMPGLVLNIRVQPGDEVSEGDPLLVLEAMKMENELRAEAGAVVKEVSVAAGEAVTKGQVLIRFGDGESG